MMTGCRYSNPILSIDCSLILSKIVQVWSNSADPWYGEWGKWETCIQGTINWDVRQHPNLAHANIGYDGWCDSGFKWKVHEVWDGWLCVKAIRRRTVIFSSGTFLWIRLIESDSYDSWMSFFMVAPSQVISVFMGLMARVSALLAALPWPGWETNSIHIFAVFQLR